MKKKLLFISFFIFVSMKIFGQANHYVISFEGTGLNENDPGHKLFIDTISNPDNIWQIGHPDKTIFNTAHSSPNVIVTDTLNSYPVNDTSSFTIIHLSNFGWANDMPNIFIDGWYNVNSDTLTDYAYIDFSPDHGNTWYYLDSALNNGCCFGPPNLQELPTFTGNSFGWKYFHYCLCASVTLPYGDTVLYRFTFISDNIQTNKDGIMFDDLYFEDDQVDGIIEFQNDNLISIIPNPTTNSINIMINGNDATNEKNDISIFNAMGKIIYQNRISSNQTTIDLSSFAKGIYFIKVQSGDKIYTDKVIVY